MIVAIKDKEDEPNNLRAKLREAMLAKINKEKKK